MIGNKAILVGLETPGYEAFDDSMDELATLAHSANYEVIARFVQKGNKPTPGYYIGSGKLEELKRLIADNFADLVIFNNELSAVHFRNLELGLDIKVLDRTVLILEIFEMRAHSQVAKLQVSLARDQYMLPRLIGKYRELSRQRGATTTIGGPGEQKLELERRRLRTNILRDRRALQKMIVQRNTQRKKRQDNGVFTVAIVGYTNSGKSTLLNRLTEHSRNNPTTSKKVLSQDLLFSSLDTAARLIVLPNNRRFVAIDTIGFIRDLPPHLVAAFRSTLEEIELSDLIVIVMDPSVTEAQYNVHMTTIETTLADIWDGPKPLIFVVNKIDLMGHFEHDVSEEMIFVSALKDIGFQVLEDKISEYMDDRYVQVVLCIPYTEPDLYSALQQEGHIINIDYGSQLMTIDVELPRVILGRFQQYVATTVPNGGDVHKT